MDCANESNRFKVELDEDDAKSIDLADEWLSKEELLECHAIEAKCQAAITIGTEPMSKQEGETHRIQPPQQQLWPPVEMNASPSVSEGAHNPSESLIVPHHDQTSNVDMDEGVTNAEGVADELFQSPSSKFLDGPSASIRLNP